MDKDIEKLLAMGAGQPTLSLAISEGIEAIQADETGQKFGFQCQQYVWQWNPNTTATREEASNSIVEACDGVYHEMNTQMLTDKRIKSKTDIEQHACYDLVRENLGAIIDEMMFEGGCYAELSTMLPDAHVGDDKKLRETLDNVPMLSLILYIHVNTADRDRVTIGYGVVLQWVTPTGDDQMIVKKHVHLTDAEWCLY